MLKTSDFTFDFLRDCINNSLSNGTFPECLKQANITPVFKKDDCLDKTNYRPVSILPLLSKVYERVIYNQLSDHVEQYFSSILCGFRKGRSTQHALFKLLQSWQKELDQYGYVGTVLMDLSKAYDCIPHELLLAKLEAYGLNKKSLNLVLDYLSDRKQRTKISSSYSSWYNIVKGVPQGSILGPLLFNIFINDMFFFVSRSEICNFADDNTLYNCNKNLLRVFKNLQFDVKNTLKWFKVNSLKANPEKFQFMVLGSKKNKSYILDIDGIKITDTHEVKLLGVTIDKELKFDKHIENLCKNATYKLHALRRLRKYLTLDKAKLLANSFIHSQFNYAPLIWMFASKTLISKVNKLHYRTLQVVHNDYDHSYEELLNTINDVSIHQKHLRYLVTEIYKSIRNLNPEFMWEYFQQKPTTYRLRNGSLLALPPARSTRYGINSLLFRSSLIWNTLPNTIKTSSTVTELKIKLKALGNIHCSCNVCR